MIESWVDALSQVFQMVLTSVWRKPIRSAAERIGCEGVVFVIQKHFLLTYCITAKKIMQELFYTILKKSDLSHIKMFSTIQHIKIV